MQICRSNYEIWLIDFLDGNLSNDQVEHLMLFLNENPDLKQEFEEMTPVHLKPSGIQFSHKEILKKSFEELSGSQFEYLCIAFMENDLSEDQKTELIEIIEREPAKKRIFELIQKTRLSAISIGYKHKNKLLRRTPLQRVVRLSVAALSAAASVAILIMSYFLFTRNLSEKIIPVAQNIVIDTILQNTVLEIIQGTAITEKKPVSLTLKREAVIARMEKNIPAIVTSDLSTKLQRESTAIVIGNHEPVLNKIPFNTDINIKNRIVSNVLIASNSESGNQFYDDERSNVSRFFARTFREKILKDPVSKDKPLKGYEIAEAGVNGLNKLLGWEMALDQRNDENGELRSVYFSSKILKFNTPVKKSQPLP